MKTTTHHRFYIDTIRSLAGEKVFARGEAYHRDDQVVILSIEPDRVLAQVSGTEDYRTKLTGHGKKIGGECSCSALDDWAFCKHLVATALAANAAHSDAPEEGAGALARIRDHLRQKGIDALVNMIVELAENDLALFRRLDMAAATVGGSATTLEARPRKALDAATRTNGFVEYDAAAGWADGVHSVLDAIGDLALIARMGALRNAAAQAAYVAALKARLSRKRNLMKLIG